MAQSRTAITLAITFIAIALAILALFFKDTGEVVREEEIPHTPQPRFHLRGRDSLLGLIDRVQLSLARAVSMEARNKTDANLNDRPSSKSLGTALKQQVLSLGMEVPMVTWKRIANSIPRVNSNHVNTNSKDHILLLHVL